MTKLSVNINKIATLRNARGGNVPNLMQFAVNAQRFGAEGITIHPRPDQRHIRYQDAHDLTSVITTEYNIEGKPIPDFMKLVLQIKPTQVTLVPDAENVLTSNAGWDTITHKIYLKEIITELKNNGIRTSIFVDPELKMIEGAKETGTDRIELYTESYAENYNSNMVEAIKPYIDSALLANNINLGINAGHDLSLNNILYFHENIPNLKEVSIGHALISESIYFGVENVIQMYLSKLQ